MCVANTHCREIPKMDMWVYSDNMTPTYQTLIIAHCCVEAVFASAAELGSYMN